jgi:hypothetical protein
MSTERNGWSNARLRRFSSRGGRLDHALLRERLRSARRYRRIAGYFRSSIFEIVGEDIESVELIQIVCNGDLDPRDVALAKSLEVSLKEQLSEGTQALDVLMRRDRYARLFSLLKSGRVEVMVPAL